MAIIIQSELLSSCADYPAAAWGWCQRTTDLQQRPSCSGVPADSPANPRGRQQCIRVCRPRALMGGGSTAQHERRDPAPLLECRRGATFVTPQRLREERVLHPRAWYGAREPNPPPRPPSHARQANQSDPSCHEYKRATPLDAPAAPPGTPGRGVELRPSPSGAARDADGTIACPALGIPVAWEHGMRRWCAAAPPVRRGQPWRVRGRRLRSAASGGAGARGGGAFSDRGWRVRFGPSCARCGDRCGRLPARW